MKLQTKIYFMALVIGLLMAILKVLLRTNRRLEDDNDGSVDRLYKSAEQFNDELADGKF